MRIGNDRRIGGGSEATLEHLGDIGVGEIVDVRAPGIEPVDHPCGDVEAGNGESGAARLLCQRKAHIAQTDDH